MFVMASARRSVLSSHTPYCFNHVFESPDLIGLRLRVVRELAVLGGPQTCQSSIMQWADHAAWGMHFRLHGGR